MYSFIINPINLKKYKIHSKKGRLLLKKFINQFAGSMQTEDRELPPINFKCNLASDIFIRQRLRYQPRYPRDQRDTIRGLSEEDKNNQLGDYLRNEIFSIGDRFVIERGHSVYYNYTWNEHDSYVKRFTSKLNRYVDKEIRYHSWIKIFSSKKNCEYTFGIIGDGDDLFIHTPDYASCNCRVKVKHCLDDILNNRIHSKENNKAKPDLIEQIEALEQVKQEVIMRLENETQSSKKTALETKISDLDHRLREAYKVRYLYYVKPEDGPEGCLTKCNKMVSFKSPEDDMNYKGQFEIIGEGFLKFVHIKILEYIILNSVIHKFRYCDNMDILKCNISYSMTYDLTASMGSVNVLRKLNRARALIGNKPTPIENVNCQSFSDDFLHLPGWIYYKFYPIEGGFPSFNDLINQEIEKNKRNMSEIQKLKAKDKIKTYLVGVNSNTSLKKSMKERIYKKKEANYNQDIENLKQEIIKLESEKDSLHPDNPYFA